MNFANVKTWTIQEGEVIVVKDSNNSRIIWQKQTGPDYSEPFYVENTSNEDEIVDFYSTPSSGTSYLWKSNDGLNWTSVTIQGMNAYVTITPNQKIYFRYRVGHYSKTNLQILNVYKIGGNIMSLFYGDDFDGQTEFPANQGSYAFQGLFKNNNLLTDASKLLLPALTLRNYCYSSLFNNCGSLVTVPELPATTLNEYCYDYMFGYCTSLTTAPELSATTLTNKCYSRMFLGASSLNYVKCLATTNVNETNCQNWVYNVESTGTFVKKTGVTWSTGVSGIPSGWTVQEV